MNASDSTLDLSAQAEGFTIAGGAGIDTIKVMSDDIITGSGSNDVFVLFLVQMQLLISLLG